MYIYYPKWWIKLKWLICLLRKHKPFPIRKDWDGIGDYRYDYWQKYECDKCGHVIVPGRELHI